MIDSVSLRFGPAYHFRARARASRTPTHPGLEGLAAEFPTVALAAGSSLDADRDAMCRAAMQPTEGAGDAMTIDLDRWLSGEIDFYGFDAHVDARAAAGTVTLRVVGARAPHAMMPPVVETALEVLTRCQRWVGRRNASSRSPMFDRVLALHRQLHDVDKPLVRADHAHALDVWQWLLRLAPHAGIAVQIAALFHDCERLVSEADERLEHRLAECKADRHGRSEDTIQRSAYDAFKQAHARGSARMTREVLSTLDMDEDLLARVTRLIACHDRPGAKPENGPGEQPAHAGAMWRERDPELALLEDADGLSFFSLNSAGFLDYYGPAHTRRKIAWTLARMGPEARARLRWVRLRADVARLARDVMRRVTTGRDATGRVPTGRDAKQ